MTAKEYLKQIKVLEDKINIKLLEKESLFTIATKVTPTLSDMKVQCSIDNNKSSDIVIMYTQLEDEINQLIDQLSDLKKSVALTLKSLDTPYADILNKIYVEFKSISYISSETGLTRKYYSMLHEVALENLKKNTIYSIILAKEHHM